MVMWPFQASHPPHSTAVAIGRKKPISSHGNQRIRSPSV